MSTPGTRACSIPAEQGARRADGRRMDAQEVGTSIPGTDHGGAGASGVAGEKTTQVRFGSSNRR